MLILAAWVALACVLGAVIYARWPGHPLPSACLWARSPKAKCQRQPHLPVYDLYTEMLKTRRVSDATYQRALDTFGMQTLVELIAIIGYYCMVSITLNAFEVPLPPGEASPFPD